MRSREIVDVDADPREERQRRRRLWLRLGLPTGAVLLIVVSIIAITYYAYVSNRRDALGLSHDVLSALDERVVTQVQSYLTPPVRVLKLMQAVIVQPPFDAAGRVPAERLAAEVLRNVPHLATVIFGDADGNFLMLRRTAERAIDSKVIENGGAGRRVFWVRRDVHDATIAVEDDPADPYDPRSRPWFKGALQGDRVFWSDVYIFFTDHKPGITASARLPAAEGQAASVVGVDIRLEALSEFLASLKIGRTGKAKIIDGEGRLVAFPDPQRMMKPQGDTLVPARIDEVGDPLLTHAFDRLRVEGPGQHVMETKQGRIIVAERPLASVVGREWSLVFVVPEDDFVGFVAANNRTTLLMSLAVVALAIALAVLLAMQGLRADREARRLRRRQRTLQAHGSAFAELAACDALFEPRDSSGVRDLAVIVARALAARRVSLWRLDAQASQLVCETCWDEETKGYTAGAEFVVRDSPALFEALAAGEIIDTVDAAADSRTAELYRIYLQPVGCRSLLAMPVRSRGAVVGSVWAEDADASVEQQADAQTFLRAVAGMLSARFAAARSASVTAPEVAAAGALRPAASAAGEGESGGGRVAPQPAMRTASIAGERNHRFVAQLAARGLGKEGTAADLFPETTVLVLRFIDPVVIAERAGKSGEAVIDRIVRELQRITEEHRIAYLKIMSDQIVAVEGFSGDPDRQAAAVIETALAIRDYCTGTFSRMENSPEFAMGIDTGMVIGSPVGFGGHAYNVWGEAVRVASAMAATAPAGSIQVTESTCRYVADRYLFRSRGAFYLQRVGEMATYVLMGRL
ncbi:MAG: adenylate/guanylate cyclase domain-containing protein [Rhodospirillales bacterium]